MTHPNFRATLGTISTAARDRLMSDRRALQVRGGLAVAMRRAAA
ncbi:hypothetical protein [Sphingomonas psychrotolerans]|nr:hypothetical protein [Sphingomonas psychrotolerans]